MEHEELVFAAALAALNTRLALYITRFMDQANAMVASVPSQRFGEAESSLGVDMIRCGQALVEGRSPADFVTVAADGWLTPAPVSTPADEAEVCHCRKRRLVTARDEG